MNVAVVVLALAALSLALCPTPSPAGRRMAALAGGGPLRESRPLVVRDVVGGLFRSGRRASGHGDVRTAVRAMAEDLEAGASPQHAWRRCADLAGPWSAVFQAAAREAAAGRDPAAAFAVQETPRARRPEPLRRLGAAWSCSATSGAAAADVLRRWVEDADAAQRAREAQRVAMAGPYASSALLAGLPLLGLLLGTAMGAAPLRVVTGSVGGAVIGSVGVLLDLAGIAWMRRILRSAAV